MDLTFEEFINLEKDGVKDDLENELGVRGLLDGYLHWCQINFAEPYSWKTVREWNSDIFDEIVGHFVAVRGPFKHEELDADDTTPNWFK
ncbi:MAG: hypothetical protein ACM3UW_02980 [Bacillota bacterium]